MGNKKIRVAVLFGGKSAEHEVSLQSAKNVINAMDQDKYEIILVGIDHDGRWHLNERSQFLLADEDPAHIRLKSGLGKLALVPGEESRQVVNVSDFRSIGPIDIVFPLLHGPFGEDGTIQGLLKLADIPFVGSGVLSSAAAMDKDVMKRLFAQAGLPQARFITSFYHERNRITYELVKDSTGIPCFIKPANLGSSVGISKVHNESEFDRAVETAFFYDNKIVIEEFITGRELECSVLGNNDPVASLPAEIISSHEFYDYDAKYLDTEGARFEIPADVEENVRQKVQDLAVEAFRVLGCSGMARGDFFLRGSDAILINEVNTIPGFTRISMYPRMWEASGIPYRELIDRLIQLGLERHEQDSRIRSDYRNMRE